MKKILNFLVLSTLSINTLTLITSCNIKSVNSKHESPFIKKPFTYQQSIQTALLENFLNQLDFEHNELDGHKLNDSMKFNEYKEIVEAQISSYIKEKFNPSFSVKLNVNKSLNSLKQDDCKIKCEVCCGCKENNVKKSFDIKFKNVNSSSLILENIKAKLTSDLIDGSTLDQIASITSKTNRIEILRLIRNLIDSNDITVTVLNPLKMNLSQTDSVVKIKISHYLQESVFEVKFKNVKTYSEKDVDDLLKNAKNKIKKPVSGIDFDDQMVLESECLTKVTKKIENIIKDERVNIKVIRSKKTFAQLNNEIKFEISINYKEEKKSKLLVLTFEDVLASKWHKLLKQIEENLIRKPIDCKKSIKNNINLIYQENREQIENILKDYIENQEVGIAVLTKNNVTLEDCKYKINVRIFNYQGSLERMFNIELCNTEFIAIKSLDKTKVEELENLSLRLLLGADSTEKSVLKISYRKFLILLHGDKLNNFFEGWWKKIKKINCSFATQFDSVYRSLGKAVFFKLSQEFNKVEKVFKKLDSFDKKILVDNEDVNQFYRYLQAVMKTVILKYNQL